jgi:hypothetical protein
MGSIYGVNSSMSDKQLLEGSIATGMNFALTWNPYIGDDESRLVVSAMQTRIITASTIQDQFNAALLLMTALGSVVVAFFTDSYSANIKFASSWNVLPPLFGAPGTLDAQRESDVLENVRGPHPIFGSPYDIHFLLDYPHELKACRNFFASPQEGSRKPKWFHFGSGTNVPIDWDLYALVFEYFLSYDQEDNRFVKEPGLSMAVFTMARDPSRKMNVAAAAKFFSHKFQRVDVNSLIPLLNSILKGSHKPKGKWAGILTPTVVERAIKMIEALQPVKKIYDALWNVLNGVDMVRSGAGGQKFRRYIDPKKDGVLMVMLRARARLADDQERLIKKDPDSSMAVNGFAWQTLLTQRVNGHGRPLPSFFLHCFVFDSVSQYTDVTDLSYTP